MGEELTEAWFLEHRRQRIRGVWLRLRARNARITSGMQQRRARVLLQLALHADRRLH